VPELRHLRAFVAVAQELNFTRAAERLHLGQQAVSKSVRQLERELGVTLLERTTREVRVTPAGAALLDGAVRALDAADAAFARAREVGRGASGTVRVGVSPAVGAPEREEVARALREGAPELSVSFHDVRPGQIRSALRSGEVEVVVARMAAPGEGVAATPLRPTPAELRVPAGHRLSGRDAVGLAELNGERLLAWSPPGTAYTDMLVATLAAAGAAVTPVESRVTGGGSLSELSEAGAVALVPVGWPAAPGIAAVPVAEDVGLPLVALWREGPPPSSARRLREGMGARRPDVGDQ
jgi:DNA-binding transcriptional LysR family regulator